METTGVYWKPVYYLLEDDFELLLVNAAHVKNVPGRKTVGDAQWLCQLLEHGLLRPSYVPPKPIRELRDLTRYRKSLVWERQPRPMLARGKLRRKLPELRRALQGRFSSHHALIVSRLLAHVDYLDETIAELSGEIEQRLRPFEPEVELLCTIPGVAQRTAEVILAEFGPDMGRFPSHRHAASWAAICPGNDESAGKRRTGKTRKGDGWLRTALVEAANSAAERTRNTYLNAQYVRIKRRRGHRKAIIAVAHSILVSAYHILRRPALRGSRGDYFLSRERPDRLARHLVRQLERLGQRVTLEPVAEGAR